MGNLWSSLAPLIIGSAVVPIQIVVTILLLRSSSGRRTAVAWVAGMTTVRLLQGVVFGLVIQSSESGDKPANDSSTIVSVLLLVVAIMFLVTAARQLLGGDDPDAAPPKWLQATASLTPVKAYLVGAGLLVIGAKFWVFTLGAIAAIGDADLSRSASIGTFLLFVVLAASIHLALVGVAFLVPAKADAVLERASVWLTKHNRLIMIVLGVVFGTWFLLKGLNGLGVI